MRHAGPRLDRVLGSHDGNYSRLARATGYCRSHVSKVLRGKVGASFTCAQAIADAAGVELEELAKYVDRKR